MHWNYSIYTLVKTAQTLHSARFGLSKRRYLNLPIHFYTKPFCVRQELRPDFLKPANAYLDAILRPVIFKSSKRGKKSGFSGSLKKRAKAQSDLFLGVKLTGVAVHYSVVLNGPN